MSDGESIDPNSDFSAFVTDDRQWMRLCAPPGAVARRTLFMDRDGVMIEDRGYLSDPDGVSIIPGCADVMRKAQALGWAAVVVSNQSGIGRGYFGWREHFAVENRMLELLKLDQVKPDALLACPCHPGGLAPYNVDHAWRKPHPGMLAAAASALNLDLPKSVIIGDRTSDLSAGRAAGLTLGVHVRTGHGASDPLDPSLTVSATFDVVRLASIADAMDCQRVWG